MENLNNLLIILWVAGMVLPLIVRAVLINRLVKLSKTNSVSSSTRNWYILTGELFLLITVFFACAGFYYVLNIPLGIVQLIFLFCLMLIPLDVLLVYRKAIKQRPPSSF